MFWAFIKQMRAGHKGRGTILNGKFIKHPNGCGGTKALFITKASFVGIHVERHPRTCVWKHIARIDHAGAYMWPHYSFNYFQYLRPGINLTENITLVSKIGEAPHSQLDVVLFTSLITFKRPEFLQPGKQGLNL